MLRRMFNDPVSLDWIYFLESQMNVCSISTKKIHSDSISGSDVAVELDILSYKMKSRRDENFHTTKCISLLSDVEEVYSNEHFTEVANTIYNTFLLCLEKCSNSFLPLDMFHWALPTSSPTWEKSYIVEGTLPMLTKI
jgi:hypothetical protein